MTKRSPVAANTLPAESGDNYPEPFHSRMGDGNWRSMGDHFGLSQFGCNLETLQPGAQSAMRHWHTLSDEMIYMVSGELTLITDDGPSTMTPGMCVGFKAGDRNAHHLVNNSPVAAQFLVVGTRVPGDTGFYPDDDCAWFRTPDGNRLVHKDGTPFPPSTGTP